MFGVNESTLWYGLLVIKEGLISTVDFVASVHDGRAHFERMFRQEGVVLRVRGVLAWMKVYGVLPSAAAHWGRMLPNSFDDYMFRCRFMQPRQNPPELGDAGEASTGKVAHLVGLREDRGVCGAEAKFFAFVKESELRIENSTNPAEVPEVILEIRRRLRRLVDKKVQYHEYSWLLAVGGPPAGDLSRRVLELEDLLRRGLREPADVITLEHDAVSRGLSVEQWWGHLREKRRGHREHLL